MASSPPSLPPAVPPPPPQQPPSEDFREMPTAAELAGIGIRSLKVGGATGAVGLFVGAGAGIVRSAPPTLFALVASFQWFTLGSSYTGENSLHCCDKTWY